MKIHYEIVGEGEPLLLIAGYTCSSSIWASVRDLLASRFQLILFDNRGSGQSEVPDVPYSIEMMGQDTLQLIERLGLERPHILGHSMGGFIAQWLAAHHPDKVGKVILANTGTQCPAYFNLRCWAQLHLRENHVPIECIVECGAPWIFSNQFLSQPNALDELIRGEKNDLFPQSLVGQRRQLEALEKFDSNPWYGNIGAPTLVLAADEERVFPPSEADKLTCGIEGAQFYLFKGNGHAPQIEAPNEFAAVVLDFLGK